MFPALINKNKIAFIKMKIPPAEPGVVSENGNKAR
jgi:hypothetical protein